MAKRQRDVPTMISPHERVQKPDQHVLAHAFFEASIGGECSKHCTSQRDKDVVQHERGAPERIVSDLLLHLAGPTTYVLQECLSGDIVYT